MNHKDTTRAEFSRQAANIEKSPEFTDAKVLNLIADACLAGPGRKILDVGCGPGILCEVFASLGADVTGIDLTGEMVERAKARCHGMENAVFFEGDAENLPFADGVFDSAATRLTIHHYSRPEEVLSEIRRVLKPGGLLLVADITSAADEKAAGLHNALETLRDPSHIKARCEKALLEMITGAGFGIMEAVSWKRERTFPEWAAITGAPERAGPLETVMRTLAENGIDAGIGLRIENGAIAFRHSWVMVTALKNNPEARSYAPSPATL